MTPQSHSHCAYPTLRVAHSRAPYVYQGLGETCRRRISISPCASFGFVSFGIIRILFESYGARRPRRLALAALARQRGTALSLHLRSPPRLALPTPERERVRAGLVHA